MAILKRPTSVADRLADADARADAFIAGAPDGGRLAPPAAPALRQQRPGRAGKRLQVAFTVTPETLAAFDAVCAARGVTRSAGLALAMSKAVQEGL